MNNLLDMMEEGTLDPSDADRIAELWEVSF